MEKIGIIGSGNVGANIAFFLAEKAVGDVVLFDVQDGLSQGKALDMMEVAPIRAYRSRISGADTLNDIKDSDILIVTAGSVRTPGMKREELFAANAPVITEVAKGLAGTEAVVIIVSEPVDFLTTLFIKESGLKPEKVLGLGGCLDSARLRFLLSQKLEVSTENVTAMVIGRHADEMIPLKDYCRVSGIPITEVITDEEVQEAFEDTKTAGGLIVDMAQRANAYYGPSAVAAEIAESVVKNSGRILSISTLFTGQFGIEGVAMSLPCIIGEGGIRQVLEPVLTDAQKGQLRASGDLIRKSVSV